MSRTSKSLDEAGDVGGIGEEVVLGVEQGDLARPDVLERIVGRRDAAVAPQVALGAEVEHGEAGAAHQLDQVDGVPERRAVEEVRDVDADARLPEEARASASKRDINDNIEITAEKRSALISRLSFMSQSRIHRNQSLFISGAHSHSRYCYTE